ncbi:MAG: hypothetical protein AVDCRST_MAG41-3597 [uncultured Corynebacteriales bacterium]|uniref:Uncharacterized protein n=1 Tax=uncultured Mycobacteriales bacterium TaxID=581187 RepID=A0A6J4JKU5_9ACTN|nr:MAG: hypothetical protein AVDCRST_MAG41-3597 [uncultured Corynebacteriales bacterium]
MGEAGEDGTNPKVGVVPRVVGVPVEVVLVRRDGRASRLAAGSAEPGGAEV